MRCLSVSDRLDMLAVKGVMTELLFAPENVKRRRLYVAGPAVRQPCSYRFHKKVQ